MAKEIINDGVIPNDGQGDNLRLGAQKINSNFDELYNALGNGSTLSTISSNTVTATGGNKITFYFATEGDLPNATTYDGMFAHVHSDNTNRVAHSGTWVKLIQETSSIDMLADVETSSPAPTDGQALVWSNANSRWQAGTIDAGASTFVSLSDTPANFSGAGSKFVQVNSGANAVEFTTPSIDKMSDVDTTTTPPTAGQVLKWSGTKWQPAADATSGGAGSDADTLDGLDSTYFLNYTNLTNKPTIATALVGLTDTPANYTGAASRFLKVNSGGTGIEFSTSGTGALYINELGDVDIFGTTYTATGATYTPASGVLNIVIGSHTITPGMSVLIKENSLTFTCAQDSHATNHSYPRSSGSNAPGGADYAYNTPRKVTAADSTSITVNVGVSSNTTAHTFVSATASGIQVAPTEGDTLYFDGNGWKLQNGPISKYEFAADGNNNYVWSGPGFSSGTNDPVMYMNRGHTYVLSNTSGTHPFEIRVSNGGSAYTNGVSGDKTGVQIFKVPMDAPTTLYYQCTSHSAMGNTINIVS